MNEDDSIGQLEKADEALANAQRDFGDDSLEVAACLEHCARLLRASKQELLKAANYEAKARVIRKKNSTGVRSQIGKDERGSNSEASGGSGVETVSGGTRKCPYCGASMPKEALLCRKCNPKDADSLLVQQMLSTSTPGMRVCPFCAGEFAADSNICWHCNAKLTAIATNTTGISLSGKTKRVNPILMASISLFTLNGIGQWKMGQKKKGTAMIVVSLLLGAITMGFSVLLTAPFSAVDAYLIGKKLQRGLSVGEWEFF